MPVTCGWHPWWSRRLGDGGPAELDFRPEAMYQRDEDGIPTGELVPPSRGPVGRLLPDAADADPGALAGSASRSRWRADCAEVVVFDQRPYGVCVEPQTGPPDAVNLGIHCAVLGPGRRSSSARARWTWRRRLRAGWDDLVEALALVGGDERPRGRPAWPARPSRTPTFQVQEVATTGAGSGPTAGRRSPAGRPGRPPLSIAAGDRSAVLDDHVAALQHGDLPGPGDRGGHRAGRRRARAGEAPRSAGRSGSWARARPGKMCRVLSGSRCSWNAGPQPAAGGDGRWDAAGAAGGQRRAPTTTARPAPDGRIRPSWLAPAG